MGLANLPDARGLLRFPVNLRTVDRLRIGFLLTNRKVSACLFCGLNIDVLPKEGEQEKLVLMFGVVPSAKNGQYGKWET
jgi:hypothetical protein